MWTKPEQQCKVESLRVFCLRTETFPKMKFAVTFVSFYETTTSTKCLCLGGILATVELGKEILKLNTLS